MALGKFFALYRPCLILRKSTFFQIYKVFIKFLLLPIYSVKIFMEGNKMETILATVFSAIIIFMTVFFIIKASNIAYKKREMAIGKLIFISAASIAVGIAIVSVLPFAYKAIFDFIATLSQ